MKTNLYILLLVISISIFCCNKESNNANIDIPENTVYCKIDGEELFSSGNLLLCTGGCSGFAIAAYDIKIFDRLIQIGLEYGIKGENIITPDHEIRLGRYMPVGLEATRAIEYTTQKSNPKDINKISIIKNEGQNVIGTFDLTVSNGRRSIRITDGKFNIHYIR